MKLQILLFATLLTTSLTAQVSISADGSSPDGSSMLDVKSSNKGMLIPRVALTGIDVAMPVVSPATGLLIYNMATTGTPPNNVVEGFYSWNGTRWISVAMPQGATTGDMLYWDGTQWMLVPAGDSSQILRLCYSVPTWGPCIPSITTTPICTITPVSVVSGGNMTNDRGDAVTVRGVCWNTTGSPTTADSYTEDGSGPGAFASDVAGLSSGIIYYLRAYATNSIGTGYGNELIFCADGSDSLSCAGIPTYTYGGHIYNTVRIGTQCWMRENLNYGNMINGSLAQTDNQVVEKYCYDSDLTACPRFGALYQWDELMNYSTQEGAQGICPSGWHIPSDGEFCILVTYLDPTVICEYMTGWTGTNAGGKMKETGTTHWWSPNGGATNSSGFTGLAGGYSYNGVFSFIMSVGHWWTSTTYGSTHGLWQLRYNDALIGYYRHLAQYGFSVRCIKAPLPVVTTSAVSDTSTTSASCVGTVVSDGGASVTARGVCWNRTGAPTVSDSVTSNGSGTGSFTSQLSNLEENTAYYVRAYATTSNGTGYGNQVCFNTLNQIEIINMISDLDQDTKIETEKNADEDNILFSTNGNEQMRITSNGRIGIGTNYPDSSAVIDVSSETKGFLLPRMTMEQRDAIVSPAAGLMVFCIDCGANGTLSMYTNDSWVTYFPCDVNVISTVDHLTTAGSMRITWDWFPVPDAIGYKWNTTNNYSAATDMGTNTSITETGLTCNTSCTRYVWAYGECSISAPAMLTKTTLACFDCGTSIIVNHTSPVTKTVTYGTVDNIPGEPTKCWITQNLGADHQADSVNDPTEPSSGWYWQFDWYQGYKHDGTTRTPNTWIYNFGNYDWQMSNDPCYILGIGWRLPTSTEWANIITGGGWTDWNGPWNSALKIHEGGYLWDMMGVLQGRGSIGQYWSSSSYDMSYGYEMFFNTGACETGMGAKGNGFSVRCLRD